MSFQNFLELANYSVDNVTNDYSGLYNEDPSAHVMVAHFTCKTTEGVDLLVTFDILTDNVFEVCLHSYTTNQALKWVDSYYVDSDEHDNTAWDDVNYTFVLSYGNMIDLIVTEAVIALPVVEEEVPGSELESVDISIELPQEDFFTLLKQAHAEDVSFNKFVAFLLEEYVRNN